MEVYILLGIFKGTGNPKPDWLLITKIIALSLHIKLFISFHFNLYLNYVTDKYIENVLLWPEGKTDMYKHIKY